MIGDHGGIIIIVKNNETTNNLKYSLNEGITWNDYQFNDIKIKVISLNTETDNFDSKF